MYQIWGVNVKFHELGVQFFTSTAGFTVYDFKRCCWISNTRGIIKSRLASSQKLRHGYVIRLTHIFAVWHRQKHHAVPKIIPELKDALQRIWTALLQKSIDKGVKHFSKLLEASVSANWGHIEYKMWSLT